VLREDICQHVLVIDHENSWSTHRC
jgi:hypothetical protein